MANKKTKQAKTDAVPTPETPSTVTGEQQETVWTPGEATPRYVVTRGGLRVSDKDYPTDKEPRAIAEKEFWQKVVKRWPDGTKVEIVPYDKKKHRIW